MGSSPSGNTMQTSNSNSTNTSGPNPFIVPQLQNLANNATGWMNNNLSMPGFFPGGTAAPQSERTGIANTDLWSTAVGLKNGGSGSGAGRQFALDTIGGKYLDPNQNPAFQDYLSASFRPQAEQFRDILAPSIDAKFAGSGRTAGGAHFDTTMRGVQDLERSQSDAAAKAGLGLYQGERANQFQAAGMLPQFQNMDYQNIQAMLQSGRGADADAQRMLDAQNAKYGYDTSGQLDWYNRLSQSLQGMYPGGQTTGQQSGTSTGTGSPGGGGAGSILGPAMGAAGLGLQAAAMFSDENLKDVAGRVGFTDEGLPLYLYKYKGTSEPRIGPIAQEVEDLIPGAVTEHPSGYKIVDYSRLVPEGGLL